MGNFDEYFPFDKGFGATANSARWRKMAQLWCCDGVLQGYLNGLTTTASGTTATVQTGAVFIHGYYAEIQTNQNISIGANGTIVAKVDLVNEVCSVYYKDGALDYGSVPATSYEQSASNWEIPLFLVAAGPTLTDLRTWVGPGRVTAFWGQSTPSFNIAAGASQNQSITPVRVPYSAPAILRGSAQITIPGPSPGNTVTAQLYYQYGQGDVASTPVATVQSVSGNYPIFMTGFITVTPGLKQLALRVTNSAGAATVSAAQAIASLELVNQPARI